MCNNQFVINYEYVFKGDDFLILRINCRGCIIYVNLVFIEVSGFICDELIGVLYNIVCYFDMLEQVFENLWSIFKDGGIWIGLVKNWCKDGGYYWVCVYVILVVEDGEIIGFVFVCFKVDKDVIVVVEQVYIVLWRGVVGIFICIVVKFVVVGFWWYCGVGILSW